MEPKWTDLIKQAATAADSLRYPLVRQFYPLAFADAAGFAARLLRADPLHRQDAYAIYLGEVFAQLESCGHLLDVPHLVSECSTRESVLALCDRAGLDPNLVGGALYFIAYGLYPRNFYLRDLIEKGDALAGAHCVTLRKLGISNTLDLLERARTRDGRARLSDECGIPLEGLTELVHRADLTRMGTTGGNMVRNYMNSGVRTFRQMVEISLDELTERMTFYLASLGKVPKYGIDIPAAHAQARVYPLIVEE